MTSTDQQRHAFAHRRDDQLELGQRVRALRLSRGLSQADLARPYSRAYVSLLESGGIDPSPRALETLAARLGVSPDVLMRQRLPC
jgi:transcriptional regulator with XRE-family HTH domain